MLYIYLAGPLFKEAEINQRRLEGKKLKEVLDSKSVEYFLANPIDLPLDNTKVLTSAAVFKEDYYHVNQANVFFFELASEDSGTMVELGNAIEKYMQGQALKIYPVIADLRLPRNNPSGVECPFGINSYVVGCLTANNIEIFTSFNDALKQFIEDLEQGLINRKQSLIKQECVIECK